MSNQNLTQNAGRPTRLMTPDRPKGYRDAFKIRIKRGKCPV